MLTLCLQQQQGTSLPRAERFIWHPSRSAQPHSSQRPRRAGHTHELNPSRAQNLSEKNVKGLPRGGLLCHLPRWVLPSVASCLSQLQRTEPAASFPSPDGFEAGVRAPTKPHEAPTKPQRSPHEAPLRQPGGQVLRGASEAVRAGEAPPSSLLPTPPHTLVALQGLIHSRVTNMQMGAFAWAGRQAAGCQGTRGSRRWGEAWRGAACSPGPAWQQAMEL